MPLHVLECGSYRHDELEVIIFPTLEETEMIVIEQCSFTDHQRSE